MKCVMAAGKGYMKANCVSRALVLVLAVAIVLVGRADGFSSTIRRMSGGSSGGGMDRDRAIGIGRDIASMQRDRALYVGHHVPNLLDNYTMSELSERNWQPIVLHSSQNDDKDVLVIRKKREGNAFSNQRVRDDCHILFMHGNVANLMSIIDSLELLENRLRCNMYAVEYTGYPGHPNVDGEPSEEALYDDARTAAEWLSSSVPPGDRIVLYGHSLGAALALDAATSPGVQSNLAAVILEAPFLSAVRTRMDYKDNPTFQSAASFLEAIDVFDNEEKINEVNAPIFIAHATEDPVVPFEHGQQLYEKYEGKKTAIFPEGETHSLHDPSESSSLPFFSAIRSFLDEVMSGPQRAFPQRHVTTRNYPASQWNGWSSMPKQAKPRCRKDATSGSLSGRQWGSYLGMNVETPEDPDCDDYGESLYYEEDRAGFEVTVKGGESVEYQEDVEVHNMNVHVDGNVGSRFHSMLVVASSDELSRESATSRYKNCQLNTSIGPNIKIHGHFSLNENGRARIVLPAMKCRTVSGNSWLQNQRRQEQCEVLSYQLVDETTCGISDPITGRNSLP
mmetsp:Transcript_1818/g.4093  ORF Transcript_1818/g.4093 Transcript_1818/m.4093 type:complete len:563 (+) Transcript_1818:308-1996(+)